MYDFLSQDVKYLPGVGPRRAMVLRDELGVRTLSDLLYQIPSRYLDRSTVYKVSELSESMQVVQLKGELTCITEKGVGRTLRIEATFVDSTGAVKLVWFRGLKYIAKNLKKHTPYILLGKPTLFNGVFSFSHPELEEVEKSVRSPYAVSGLMPVYRVTEAMKRVGITSRTVAGWVSAVFERLGSRKIRETLPDYILRGEKLLPIDTALRQLHRPSSSQAIEQSVYRLKFDELFLVQLDILNYAKRQHQEQQGYRFTRIGRYFMDFYNTQLPFVLTDAQKRVIKEIRHDLGSGRQMNRLLQGDVGSGKTIVAVMTMLIAIDNGYQACLMAPTEILAEQHFEELRRLLEPVGVKVGLLTGTVKGKSRERLFAELSGGEMNIVVGTHALLEEPVEFSRLGFAVIDEQHRFGVEQRARLWTKSGNPPHILVMTATPIPRTLAMTVYGDLDVSVIDELPPGRKPVETLHYAGPSPIEPIRLVSQEVGKGRQVYIVYPLIKESQKVDLKDVEDGFEKVQRAFPKMRVAMLHGQMKSADKNEVMRRFHEHEIDILVATTVIEVGVNIPNASVMIIQNANRFGLAQLHQLRGRVGRGAERSYCILLTGYNLSENTRRRIEIMCQTNDGFVLAEEDLKLRGPGDIEGTQQSGVVFKFKYANVVRDNDLMQHCRSLAARIVADEHWSEDPRNSLLWQRLQAYHGAARDWSRIS